MVALLNSACYPGYYHPLPLYTRPHIPVMLCPQYSIDLLLEHPKATETPKFIQLSMNHSLNIFLFIPFLISYFIKLKI